MSSSRLSKGTLRKIGRRVVEWYRLNGRELPWRSQPTPYRVLVSEVMLQQTAVATVIPYFETWMRRFPDVATLAAASEREVLSLWEGMGYYQRARRLLRTARRIRDEHGGNVPPSRTDLRNLPGVGPYISAAVRSFAFGEDEVAVDANLVRVFMRLLGLRGTGSQSDVRRQVTRCAQAGLPPGESAQYNQGLMDFGSLICRPRNPRCADCFLREDCRAYAAGQQYEIPEPSPRRLKKIQTAIAVFWSDTEVYIQKRPPDGLFGGMWEFPGGKLKEGESPWGALVRECREELGVNCTPGEKLTELTHYYTVFEVRLHAFLCTPPAGLPVDENRRWVRLEQLGRYPMPSANRQVVCALRAHLGPGRPA